MSEERHISGKSHIYINFTTGLVVPIFCQNIKGLMLLQLNFLNIEGIVL